MTKEDIIKNSSPISIGSTIEGTVVARDRSSLFIDLGINGTGIIYGREFYEAKDAIKGLQIGDKVFSKVVELENDKGYKELSLKDAAKEMSWRKLNAMKESRQILSVRINGVNKGGLLATLENIPGFLPVSQLAPENYPRVADADKQKILRELQKFIGKTMEVKILDLSIKENKLIFSEKAKAEEKIKEALKNYSKGDVVDGQITGIADFGAFIKFSTVTEENSEQEDVPGSQDIEGLIHISELDWQLVESPAEVVKVGDMVKAKIIDINNNQVFLSLKALKSNPWEEIEKQYKKGDALEGKVIQFSDFGAFVEISSKIRGLCHISEFSSREEMEQKLKIDKTYKFEVMLIETKEHRMSLKLVQNK